MSTLFSGVTAVLMDGGHTILKNAYVTVDKGVITSVSAGKPDGIFDTVIEGQGKVLMPGFVNCHTHVPMTLMRGYAGGHDLQTWLNDYIFPAEAKLDGRAVRAGTALALAELISCGVTCFADMYYFCDEIIEETLAAGLSANIARGITAFTRDFDFKTYPATQELRALTTKWNGCNNGQIKVDACIHGEYTSYPAVWQSVADYAASEGLGMHVHLSETKSEHEECVSRNGMTPAATFEKYGLWNTRAIAAHCVWTTPEDWAILARRGVTAVHNPYSNLKLGSGIAPIPAMKKAGVNIALGTDGVSSNNSHDMFEEMKLASVLHNGVSHDPMALTQWDALSMATASGAKALGRNTGRIAVGCDADLILLDFDHPNLVPCHDVAANLVYAANKSDVVLTMARGEILYRDGEYFTIDLEKVRHEVDTYAVPKLFG